MSEVGRGGEWINVYRGWRRGLKSRNVKRGRLEKGGNEGLWKVERADVRWMDGVKVK